MTGKRFENRLNKDNVKFNTLNPVWDNEKQDALNVFEMIDMLNHLHEENEQLKEKNKKRLQRLKNQRKELKKQQEAIWGYKGDIKQLKKENEELKEELKELKIDNKGKDDAIDGLQEMMAHYNLGDLE